MGTWCVKSLVGELVHVLRVEKTSRDLGEQGGVFQCLVAQ